MLWLKALHASALTHECRMTGMQRQQSTSCWTQVLHLRSRHRDVSASAPPGEVHVHMHDACMDCRTGNIHALHTYMVLGPNQLLHARPCRHMQAKTLSTRCLGRAWQFWWATTCLHSRPGTSPTWTTWRSSNSSARSVSIRVALSLTLYCGDSGELPLLPGRACRFLRKPCLFFEKVLSAVRTRVCAWRCWH